MPDSAELIPKILRTGSITEDTILGRMNTTLRKSRIDFAMCTVVLYRTSVLLVAT